MRTPTCPRCHSTTLTLRAVGVCEWDGSRWWPTGEWVRCILACSDCGHTWKSMRDPTELERLL